MLILNDSAIQAQKRAALITTAITWFFNNIPVAMLPLPFQPTVMLLQKLVPYLGYIGTFIAWSWNTVKSYDVGEYFERLFCINPSILTYASIVFLRF